jgi:hypothetical protein
MVHTFHKVPHGAAPGKSAQDGIENMHIVNYIYTDKPAQLKSKLQHNETGSAAVRTLSRLCYHPAVFFRHLRLVALSLPQNNFGTHLKTIYSIFF